MRILPLLLAIAFPLSAEDWPQFLGPRRDGSYQGKAFPAWPAAGPQQLWQTQIGAGFAGPAVAEGKLILFHRLDHEEIVDCLNAVTGKPIWRARYGADYVDDFRFDNGPRAVPAIAGGRLHPRRPRHGARVGFENRQGSLETGRSHPVQGS